jgi:hypothetical protein
MHGAFTDGALLRLLRAPAEPHARLLHGPTASPHIKAVTGIDGCFMQPRPHITKLSALYESACTL